MTTTDSRSEIVHVTMPPMSRAAARWAAEMLREQAAEVAHAGLQWQVTAVFEGPLTAEACERAAEVRSNAASDLLTAADALDAAADLEPAPAAA